MPNRRLLLFTTDLLRGGTPTVVREIATRMHRDGVDVQVACMAGRGETGDEIAAAGVPVHPLGARTPRDLYVLRSFRSLIERLGVSHVLSFLLHANATAAWAARYCPDVAWYQSIQTTQPRPRWHWPVQRWAARCARKVIVPSRSVAAVSIARCRVPNDRLVVIPNGVDSRCFDLNPKPDPAGIVRVCFIGRLDPVKHVPDLIRAVAELKTCYRLDIWGDGPERSRLEAFAATDRRLAGRVTFHGAIPHPAVALARADLLVLPSEAEGFGMVLIEAMAAGVPVVASRAPGIVDVVEENATGVMFDVGDVDDLARAIPRALDEPGRSDRVQAARGTVRMRYDWDNLTRQYLDTLGLS